MINLAKRKVIHHFFLVVKVISGPAENKPLSITVGFYLSLIPLIGTTTVLSFLVSAIFKLNHFIVQSLNIFLSPLQILLVYPFLKIGRMLFFHDSSIFPKNISATGIFFVNSWNQLSYIAESVIGGIAFWAVFSLSTGFFFFRLLNRINFEKSNTSET